ncbi:hypothetical protein HID58_060459 [Brassica napus]|uniref:Uncharacterized protein n=1 Tax=Brassica napus TaxID=3708 RepID=A0ABQ7ZWH4_BRANA|nr:hypothetical protein HID58_060459 [Brassica napus]
MKPPIELDDENAAPPVHVVKSTLIPVEITVKEVSIQGTHVASLSASTPTTDESQKIKTTSTNSTATPDPRWPSKCCWSMESPPPVTSTGTVSIEGKISGPEMSSKPTVVSNGIEDMRHQIDVNDLESTLKDSSETEYIMGVSNSGVEPELEAAGGSKSSPSTGLPPITTISPEISVDSSIPKFVPSIGALAKPLAFIPPATPPTPATPSGFDLQYLNNLLDSFWPTLPDGLGSNQKKKDHPSLTREFPRMPVQKILVPELKEDGTLRFPWAARMDPATRNLYRAAKPTFRHDGTPQVEMEKVLVQPTVASNILVLPAENVESSLVSAEEA